MNYDFMTTGISRSVSLPRLARTSGLPASSGPGTAIVSG